MTDIQQHIASIRARIPEHVTLICVSKFHPHEAIMQAYACGERDFGESRVQELIPKYEALPKDIRWHFIGHLQTNKVRQIVGKVDAIDSVDSLRVAEAISKHSEQLGIVTPILVEVNIGGEEAKSGIAPERLEELLYQISPLKGVSVYGLMTIPPILEKESEKRAIFSKMYQLFVDIREKNIDNITMQELSMGMSGDFREAILEGSTMVRIGSALFGERNY